MKYDYAALKSLSWSNSEQTWSKLQKIQAPDIATHLDIHIHNLRPMHKLLVSSVLVVEGRVYMI